MPRLSTSPATAGSGRALNAGEVITTTLVVAAAATIIVAYAVGRLGLSFLPWPMAAVFLAAAAATFWNLKPGAEPSTAAVVAWAGLVAGLFAWLMWLARPWFLPVSTGPDLSHHLQLIRYFDERWHLVSEPGMDLILGEMAFYTPGSHMLASFLGAWSGTTGVYALQPLLSLITALKAGLVALIARRMLPAASPRDSLAIVVALTLFASQVFFLGPFLEYGFVAQVVAELFLMFAWWTLVMWNDDGDLRWIVLFSIAGAALFLTWPVLVGPPLLLLALVVLFCRPHPLATRVVHGLVGAALPLIVAAWFTVGRTAFLQMAGTGGKAAVPAVSAYGWWFLAASSAGLLLSLFTTRTRVTAFMAISMLAQAAALWWVATRQGHTPYMAQKMFYAFIYVQATGIAAVIGAVWPVFARWKYQAALSWAPIAIAVSLVVATVYAAPRNMAIRIRPALTQPLERAGEWAHANLAPQCVDYLVSDDTAAEWLHLAILRNPRMSERTFAAETYDFTAALVRWLTPNGFPYAIAELPAVPDDIRKEFDVVQSFGTAAIVKRRGPSSCGP